jgi:hypothetical protein
MDGDGRTDEDDDRLWALHQELAREIVLPADGFVIGEPVVVTRVEYDGNPRRGFTAHCRREDGSGHVVGLAELRFRAGTAAARAVAPYHRWLRLQGSADDVQREPPRRRHKATEDDIDVSRPVDLVVLSVKERAARCRLLGSERAITLRSPRLWDAIPGEIVTVSPRKHWRYAGHPYLSGDITGRRLDAAALGLMPLRLVEQGPWDPGEAIGARGPRPAYEMERVIPGADPEEPEHDPIVESVEAWEHGDVEGAREILGRLIEADLRCLDAHAHLGSLEYKYEHGAPAALRHHEVGVRIGELSLGAGFDGVLPWGLVGNRPFLRCLHGYGLCLWRLGRSGEAGRVFERLLLVNPADNQRVRLLLPAVQAGQPWRP